MNQVVSRSVRAAMLDRKVYTELVFDSSAIGDAVLVVALVGAIRVLVAFVLGGFFNFLAFFETMIFGVAGWLAFSFAVWLVGTKLFQGDAQPQTVMRVMGFVFVTMLATIIPGTIGTVVAVLWFGAAATVAAQAVLGLELPNALATTVVALGVLYLIGLIFRVTLLFF